MSLNRDFKFTFTDDIEISDHVTALFRAKHTVIAESVGSCSDSTFDLKDIVLANKLLFEYDLVANIIHPLEHACHFLCEVLG